VQLKAGNWSYDDATTDMSLGTSTSHSFSLKTGNTGAIMIDSDNDQSSRNFAIKDGSGTTLLTVLDTRALTIDTSQNGNN
jgi:hypothetical protein